MQSLTLEMLPDVSHFIKRALISANPLMSDEER